MGVNIYYSPHRKRKYVRKYDYYEAQERFKAGESIKDLAAEYGVTESSVYQVVTPGVLNRMREYHRNRHKGKGVCPRCGGPMNLASLKYHGYTRCKQCFIDDQMAEHAAKTVRPNELWCTYCKTFHLDEEFGVYKAANPYRRGRHTVCRAMTAKQRRDRRHKAVAEGRAATKR